MAVTEDQGVMKEVLVAGTGSQKPNDCASVLVRFVGKLKDGKVVDNRAEEKGE